MKTNSKTKRLAATLLTLIMMVTLMTALALPAAAATSGTCGANLTWTLDDSGTLTISGTGAMENYDFEGCPWYNARENIDRVVIGNSATTIGRAAFVNCDNSLTAVTIGNSVTTIWECAFANCGRLTAVTIPDSVTTIGNYAFDYCESLTDVYYTGTLEQWKQITIGSGNESLTSATLHCGASSGSISGSIEDETDLFRDYPAYLNNQEFMQAFNYCKDVIDETLESADGARTNWAAYRHMLTNNINMLWTSLTNTICEAFGYEGTDNYEKYIDETTLDFLTAVCNSESTVLSTVEEVGKGFKECVKQPYDLAYKTGIEQLAMDLASASKGRYSVSDARQIINRLSNDWDRVEKAFSKVGDAVDIADVLITLIMLDTTNSEIHDLFLEKLSPNTDLYKGLTRLKNRRSGLGNVTYFWNTYLSEKALDTLLANAPNFVASAINYIKGSGSASGTVFTIAQLIIKFSTFVVDQNPGNFSVDNLMHTIMQETNASVCMGALNRDMMKFMQYKIDQNTPSDGQLAEEIEEYKIIYNAAIASMRLSLEKARKLTINSTRLKRIDTALSLINKFDFDLYYQLCKESVENEFSNKFTYQKENGTITITGISDVTLAGVELLGTEETSEKELRIIPNEIDGLPVVTIADNAFSNDSSFDMVIIPETVIHIGDDAFNGCSRLSTVIMGDSVETIDNNAFKECSALESIRFSKGIKTIGESAFENCTSLEEIKLAESIREIGDNAFSGDAGLNSCEILGQDVLIADTAFMNCNAVTISALEDSAAETFAKAQNINLHTISPIVSEIEIIKQPAKTNFDIGEEVDASGMELEVTYSDGTKKEVDTGWLLSCDVSSGGQKTVYVCYGGKTATYNINIHYNELFIESITHEILNDSIINCGLELSPYESEEKDVVLCLALYNSDGILLTTNFEKTAVSDTEGTNIEISVEAEELAENYVLKIYVWNSRLSPCVETQCYITQALDSGLLLEKIN